MTPTSPPRLPRLLLAAVLLPACGARSRQGDSSAGSSSGAASTTSTGTAGTAGGTSTSGPTSTSTSTTTTTTTTTTTAGNTDTGTGTGGDPVDYYGPCPSGLDSECPTDWFGQGPSKGANCFQQTVDGVLYSVCEPENHVFPPDEGGGCVCPPPSGGTAAANCKGCSPGGFCYLSCSFGSQCPEGMVCVPILEKCMWPPDGGGTGTGTGTGTGG